MSMIKSQSISKSKTLAIHKLLQKKYRAENKKFLVEGVKNVEEALASDWKVLMVLVAPDFFARSRQEFLSIPKLRNTPCYQVSEREFRKFSDTVHSQGIAAVIGQRVYRTDLLGTLGESSIVVALDEVTEPGNMGTIIRTCDWFGVEALLIGKESVEVFNPKVVRSAMGSIFHVPFISGVNLGEELGTLKAKGFRVCCATVQEGVKIDSVARGNRTIIVFGNEARGVSPKVMRLADQQLGIPRFGKAESLNVGVACGVVLGLIRMRATP